MRMSLNRRSQNRRMIDWQASGKPVGSQDRRVKLTKAKKEEIARKFETGEYSLRGLAREYNVSHKTISLIVDQRAKRKNDEYNRTHWMYYRPDAETMREAHRRSKEYKKRLYERGELK